MNGDKHTYDFNQSQELGVTLHATKRRNDVTPSVKTCIRALVEYTQECSDSSFVGVIGRSVAIITRL